MFEVPKSNSMAHSDAQEAIRQLDDEALLAKFLPTNVNFIVAGLLTGKFQEPKYSELRDELYAIDLEIKRRGLSRTPKHKAAIKAAHEHAWQFLRLNGPHSSSKTDADASLQVNRESVEIPAARQDGPPAVSTGAAPAREDDPSPASTSAAPKIGPSTGEAEFALARAGAETVARAGTTAAGAATLRNPNDPASWGKVSRNETCPCGSGKKYKHCHGRFA